MLIMLFHRVSFWSGHRSTPLLVLTVMMALSSAGCCINRGACTSCGDDPWVINDGGLFDPAHGACNECGEMGCGGHRPFDLARKALTCGAGCSNEIYIDEWLSDPPDCCDPCNNHGDWVGPIACGPSFFPLSWHNLFGLRQDGCAPCSTCGPEAGAIQGEVIYEDTVLEEDAVLEKPARGLPAGKRVSGTPRVKANSTPARETASQRVVKKRPFRLIGVQTHAH